MSWKCLIYEYQVFPFYSKVQNNDLPYIYTYEWINQDDMAKNMKSDAFLSKYDSLYKEINL